MISDEQKDQILKRFVLISKLQFDKRYKKLEKVGQGSFGVVWKAIDQNNKIVAIKQLNKQAQKHMKYIGRETQILKKVNHQNVVKFFDCYWIQQICFCIVLQYCEKGSLMKYINQNVLDQSDKLKICFQISKGLAYIHNIKITHRDMKTQNILVAKDNICKIGDFGTSIQNVQFKQIMQTFAGTPVNQDQRVLKQQPYDNTVDIYSLGLIFVQIYNGYSIYGNCNSKLDIISKQSQIMRNYETMIQQYLQGMPLYMKQIIKNCLQPKFQERKTALQISQLLKIQMKNYSKIFKSYQKINSTIDQQTFDDLSSVFAYKLINYTKSLNQKQTNMGTKCKLLQILSKYKQNMDNIKLLQNLRFVQRQTKSQFVVFLIFYYLLLLDEVQKCLQGQNSFIFQIYKQIKRNIIDENTKSRLIKHIDSQRLRYHPFLITCSREIKKKTNLSQNKKYLPLCLKKIIDNSSISSVISQTQFNTYNFKQQIHRFYNERVKRQFNSHSTASQFNLNDLVPMLDIIQKFDYKDQNR